MEKSDQLSLFGEEGIVSVRADHFTVIGVHSGTANRMCKIANGFRREEPVGTDADESEPGTDAAECPLG